MRLKNFFTKNLTLRQKQYEVVRAVAFEEGSVEEIAERYRYRPGSLRALISKLLTGQHILFPQVKREPRKGKEGYLPKFRVYENKLSQLVDFFSLNGLSSPMIIRIHFDLLWTIIADAFYHLFAQNLPMFEKCLAGKIFRNFVDMPGIVEYDGKEFTVKIRKRVNTPILLGMRKLQSRIRVPWLGHRLLKIIWTD